MKLLLIILSIILLSNFASGFAFYRRVTLEKLYSHDNVKIDLGNILFDVQPKYGKRSFFLFPIIQYEETIKDSNDPRGYINAQKAYKDKGMNSGMFFYQVKSPLQRLGINMRKDDDTYIDEYILINVAWCGLTFTKCYLLTDDSKDVVQITFESPNGHFYENPHTHADVSSFINSFRIQVLKEGIPRELGKNNFEKEKSLFFALKLYLEDQGRNPQSSQIAEIEHHFQRNLNSVEYYYTRIKQFLAEKSIDDNFKANGYFIDFFNAVKKLKFDTFMYFSTNTSNKLKLNLGPALMEKWNHYKKILATICGSLEEHYLKSLFVIYIMDVFFMQPYVNKITDLANSLNSGYLEVSYEDISSPVDDSNYKAEYFLSNIAEFDKLFLDYLNKAMYNSFIELMKQAKRKLRRKNK
jgi:hypothetical protein